MAGDVLDETQADPLAFNDVTEIIRMLKQTKEVLVKRAVSAIENENQSRPILYI